MTALSAQWSLPQPDWNWRPDEVHVWLATLDVEPAALSELFQTLSPEERVRAAKFCSPGLRDRFIAAHGLLRQVLSLYLDLPPSSLVFRCNSNGKPFVALAYCDIEFNLSHSDALALVAVASGCPVGVDLERVRDVQEADCIARRYFDPTDCALLAELCGDAKQQAFYRCWTRTEARLKCDGRGLGDPGPRHVFTGNFYELPAIQGYTTALAVTGNPGAVRTWLWPCQGGLQTGISPGRKYGFAGLCETSGGTLNRPRSTQSSQPYLEPRYENR